MKRILTILLFAALSGCSLSAGPAEKISYRVKQCCSTLGIATKCPENNEDFKETPQRSVVPASMVERSAQILVW